MQKYTASVITAGCLWGLMGLFTRTLATYGVDSTGAIVLRCGIAALLFAVTLLVRDPKAVSHPVQRHLVFYRHRHLQPAVFHVLLFSGHHAHGPVHGGRAAVHRAVDRHDPLAGPVS